MTFIALLSCCYFFTAVLPVIILVSGVACVLMSLSFLSQQKLEVDDLHLQLQNLMYEATYLRKEITNCLEFK